jgi:hypothetical protein
VNVIESVKHRENDNLVRLTCGHEIITPNPHVRAGNQYDCPECPGYKRRNGPPPCNDVQLTLVAEHYAHTMRSLGFDVPEGNLPVLKRAAAIQDAWRLAFASVLNK